MYAIIEDSGTQIKVSQGDVVKVDLREVAQDTTSITFDRVLLLGEDGGEGEATVGTPIVQGAKVLADILGQEKTPRIPVVKFKRRKTYLRRKGHRQGYLKVRITSISK